MRYRKFGKTDLEVSEIGFGAWAIGGSAMAGQTPIGWGSADDTTSMAAIRKAMEEGINFFDTADIYGLGHSEELVGRVIGSDIRMIIATKVGNRVVNERQVQDYTYDYIMKACEESLKRLRRPYIDYYQLHSAKLQHLRDGECIRAMQDLQQQGKIRYWGLSLNSFAPDAEAAYLMDNGLGDGFQLVFNLVNQLAAQVIGKAEEKHYGIIARMPLQFGLLSGKFSADTQFAPDDHRHFRLTQPVLAQALPVLEQKIWPLANEKHISKAGLALGFVLSVSGITTVIPGMRTAEQVELNTRAEAEFTAEEVSYFRSLSQNWNPVLDMMRRLG